MQRTYLPSHIQKCFEITDVYTIHYLSLAEDFCEEFESNNFWELVFADVGKFYIDSDSDTVYLQEGDIYISKPNQPHRCCGNFVNRSHLFVISFDCSSPEMLFFTNKLFRVTEEEKQIIGKIIQVAKATYDNIENNPTMTKLSRISNAGIGNEQIISNNAELLLLSLFVRSQKSVLRPLLSKTLTDDALIAAVVDFLESHLADDIRVSDVARHANYSVSFLSTYFKERTHYTVSEYHNILKIERSKAELKNTDLSIEEISSRLNFCNQHYFSTIFKKYVKMTPSDYRKSILSRGAPV